MAERYMIMSATDTNPRQVSVKPEFANNGITDLCSKEVMDIIPCTERTLIRWRQQKKNLTCEQRGGIYYYPVVAINKYLADKFYPVG
jgi:hypothetical protein